MLQKNHEGASPSNNISLGLHLPLLGVLPTSKQLVARRKAKKNCEANKCIDT